ncbi:MAG: hypothetical protein MUF43_13105 [Flavobacterium sp.]|jgi:hypothetical protein|nr:hypothetical protein [Flavobacterium sp.]
MPDPTQNIMTLKDKLEIAYWVVSLSILVVTIYYVYYSPIKAVKIGRQLNDDQNKDAAKRELFLTLFAYRGSPVHYEFVNALNKIDIVFQDEQPVLVAWNKYYDSLGQKNLTNQEEVWNILRVDLLSEMATSLGYNKLKQVDIMKNYYPVGHDNQFRDDWELRQAAKRFLTTGHELYEILIANQQPPDQQETQS